MWKYGGASVIGTSHARASLPLQDASRAELVVNRTGEEILLAVASDGAGSASHAHLGAALACDFFIGAIRQHFAADRGWTALSEGFIKDWIKDYQQLIACQAAEVGAKPQDYASTLLAAVVGRGQAAFFQLGDGAIIELLRDIDSSYAVVCWPQQGEYANSTNFLTDADAAQKAFSLLQSATIDEVALFTDGLQSLVLDYRTQTAHAPFFAPLFAWLRPRAAGHSQELSDSLIVYLNSEKINARTDDDKTLILATRK